MIVAGSASTACQYYVRYSTDGGKTFLGLTYEGTPGGTGCPAGNSDFASAVAWLQTKYIAQGYCCAAVATSTPRKSGGPLPTLPPVSIIVTADAPVYTPIGGGYGTPTPPTGGNGYGTPTPPTGDGYGTPTTPTGGNGYGALFPPPTPPTGGGYGTPTPPTGTGYGTPATAYGR